MIRSGAMCPVVLVLACQGTSVLFASVTVVFTGGAASEAAAAVPAMVQVSGAAALGGA